MAKHSLENFTSSHVSVFWGEGEWEGQFMSQKVGGT